MADDLDGYLGRLAGQGDEGLERGPVARLVRRALPAGARYALKRVATDALVPVARRRARRLAGERPLVNLGAGTAPLPGWLNVDLVGMTADLPWNLTRDLPFPAASVGAVLLEHVLEHFPARAGLDLLRRVHRVLMPGGVVRVAVPDMGAYMRSYCGDGSFIVANRPDRPTPMLAVAEVVYSHGHRSAWDGESLVALLRAAGFESCAVTPFGESRLAPVPDNPERKAESVYVEGVKPESRSSQ